MIANRFFFRNELHLENSFLNRIEDSNHEAAYLAFGSFRLHEGMYPLSYATFKTNR